MLHWRSGNKYSWAITQRERAPIDSEQNGAHYISWMLYASLDCALSNLGRQNDTTGVRSISGTLEIEQETSEVGENIL